MGLNWPGAHESRNDVGDEASAAIKAELDTLADELRIALAVKGLQPTDSPLFLPWSLFIGVQSHQTIAVFAEHYGMVKVLYLDFRTGPMAAATPQMFAAQIVTELKAKVVATVTLAPLGADEQVRVAHRTAQVNELATAAERQSALGRLGDLAGVTHLEPELRTFLADHPNPERNVFIMMRFIETEQFREIHTTIVDTLAERGFNGLRADDREYHSDLWANVEVYLTGCHYGITVFDDMEQRDHSPNVALELGYMKAKRRRCLILRERTLPELPTDVIGRLYKSFDKFQIAKTVRSEVTRWIEVDLGIT